MIIVYVLFFVIINLIIAHQKSIPVVDAQPLTFSVFVLVLYMLGFINNMWLVDYIVPSGLLAESVYVLYRSRKKYIHVFDVIPIKKLLEPSFLIFLTVTMIGTILLSHRGVCYFDEINFWGTDIRSIYSLQGYAKEGMNCATQYGDYTPGYQLVAAWAMHMLGSYNEGIQMSAFFLILMIFSAPVIAHIANGFVQVIGATIILPIMFAFGPDIAAQRTPDVLMGVTYGCALVYIFRYFGKKYNELFVALILANTVIIKLVGLQWALFAILFYFVMTFLQKKKLTKSWTLFLLPLIIWGSWWCFCKLNNRYSYSTRAVRLLADEINNNLRAEYGGRLLESYLKTLFAGQQPSSFSPIGISILAVFIIILLIILYFQKKGYINIIERNVLLIFLIVTWIIEYSSLLYAVENMFLGEYANYMQQDNMLMLIRRYGAPYVMGAVMLVLSIWIDVTNSISLNYPAKTTSALRVRCWLLIILFYIVFAPWKKLYTWFYGYRFEPELVESLPEQKDPNMKQLFPAFEQIKGRQKVLFLCDDTTVEVISPFAAQYYFAPVPIQIVFLNNDNQERIDKLIRSNTAVCFISGNPEWDLTKIGGIPVEEEMKMNTPYYIYADKNGVIHLSEDPIFVNEL